MKTLFSIFALVVVLVGVYLFKLHDGSESIKVQGLPWQIETFADGSSQVFGIKPGKSTLADAIAVLGNDAELAIIAKKNERGKLEMYFGHYRAGLITGKMVLQARVDKARLIQWKENAVKVEYMANGLARKYLLDSDSLPSILKSKVQSITFIPAANLDDKLIIARFGKPAEKIKINADLTHYLYPSLGLDIALSASQKDVLQYVEPTDFERLKRPLEHLAKP